MINFKIAHKIIKSKIKIKKKIYKMNLTLYLKIQIAKNKIKY